MSPVTRQQLELEHPQPPLPTLCRLVLVLLSWAEWLRGVLLLLGLAAVAAVLLLRLALSLSLSPRLLYALALHMSCPGARGLGIGLSGRPDPSAPRPTCGHTAPSFSPAPCSSPGVDDAPVGWLPAWPGLPTCLPAWAACLPAWASVAGCGPSSAWLPSSPSGCPCSPAWLRGWATGMHGRMRQAQVRPCAMWCFCVSLTIYPASFVIVLHAHAHGRPGHLTRSRVHDPLTSLLLLIRLLLSQFP